MPNTPITYQQAKDLAASNELSVRLALAQRTDLPPEIIYFLAGDKRVEVRKAIAENTSTTKQTNLMLATDVDSEVRQKLAGKIVEIPSSREAMKILANDQLVVVRQILSDALKDVPDAPANVVMTLAMDAEISVASPVLEFSPVLKNKDLIMIIGKGTAKGGLNCISRRVNVAEDVSDAIIETNDREAICELLGNKSAQIREEALDELVGRADGIDLWHAPLIARPTISANAAKNMARFLADNLLSILQERSDLPEATLKALQLAVHERLGQKSGEGDDDVMFTEGASDFMSATLPHEHVAVLYNSHRLNADLIIKALSAGDYIFVFTSLIIMSELDEKVCRIIFEQKNAKGILSLCWEAGLPIKLAVRIQQRMAKIAPSELLQSDADGRYPVDDEEMKWCLDFFSAISGKP